MSNQLIAWTFTAVALRPNSKIRFFIIFCIGFCLVPAKAATINANGSIHEYQWSVLGDATISSVHLTEGDSAGPTVAPLGQYSGNVVSPIPNKVYDTSPVLIQQPDGSFVPNISFPNSWISAEGSTNASLSTAPDASSIFLNLSSESEAIARSNPDAYNGVGHAEASSRVYYSTYFSPTRELNDGSTFSLQAEFIDSIFTDVFTTTITPDVWSLLSVDAGIKIGNVSTSEILLDERFQYEADILGNNISFSNIYTFSDVSFDDEFWFELYLSSSAFANSSFEVIFTNPNCDPTVDLICYIDRVDFENMDSIVRAGIGLELTILPNPVPLPAAAWLFGTALFVLFGFGRKKLSKSNQKMQI